MEVTHAFAAVPVRDLAAACRWYERLFGRAPDLRPNANEAVWRLNPQASIYVVADAARAGGASLTLAVADLDEHVRVLGARGVTLGGRPASGGAPRRVAITDDDGNELTFFEDPAASSRTPADFHLSVKQRELERDATQAIRALEASLTVLADACVHDAHASALARDAAARLAAVLPASAHAPDWARVTEQVHELRVTLRLLGPHLADAPAEGRAATDRLEALDVLLRRRQNLGRGERWVEG